MNGAKPTKSIIEKTASTMGLEEALDYIEAQSKLYDLNLDALKKKYQNLYEKYKAEKERLKIMSRFEYEGYAMGYRRIGGVDEAGRGPLAGPVVAACVVLKRDTFIPNVNDSKKLTEKSREKVYDMIMECAEDIGIGIVDHETIDEINILNAAKMAMKKAVENLKILPDYLLTDAVEIPDCTPVQKPIVKGDALSVSIAAASIVAKVTRDRIMCRYAEEYPCYGFENHKGYGTAEHIAAIQKYGICPIHRKLFVKNYI